MRTFRTRLAVGIAATAVALLLLLGLIAAVQVRTTLQEAQDEVLIELTRTEVEALRETPITFPPQGTVTDESLLVWDQVTGRRFLERGEVSLRAAQKPIQRQEFTWLVLSGVRYRALYYPYQQQGRRYVALCVEPSAKLELAVHRLLVRLLVTGLLGVAATCLLAWLLATRLTRPLAALAQRTRTLQHTDLQERLPLLSSDTELRVVTEALNTLLARLETAFAAQSRFVADAAHELRSPLANLKVTADVALRRGDAATQVRALEVTVAEIDRLTRLTESLLLLSRADEGRLLTDLVPVPLDRVAAEALGAIAARADARALALELSAEPVWVLGDALHLRRVFDNILDNALQFAPPGGAIRVTVQSTGGRAVVCCQDDGPGVAESALPLLFERLWRADAARARATGGFGLGLALVRAVVVAHGGDVVARNLSPHGFIVELTLPITQTHYPADKMPKETGLSVGNRAP